MVGEEDAGTDIIRFHRAITRSLEIVIQTVDRYLEIEALEEPEREGFLKYIQTFSTVMNIHHVLENKKIFPYFRDKLPDAPYGRLITQHEWVKTSISHVNDGIDDLESNIDDVESLDSLKMGLRQVEKVWHPHIRIEEEHIYGKVGSLNLSPEENKRLRKEFSQFFEEHAEPAYLVMPFLLYNLSPEDRAVQAQLFPEIVTKQLMEKDWKDDWAPMRPFLLK